MIVIVKPILQYKTGRGPCGKGGGDLMELEIDSLGTTCQPENGKRAGHIQEEAVQRVKHPPNHLQIHHAHPESHQGKRYMQATYRQMSKTFWEWLQSSSSQVRITQSPVSPQSTRNGLPFIAHHKVTVTAYCFSPRLRARSVHPMKHHN
jgi:hypothetical protein